MFDEALKLYLTYPAEMEYWWARQYPVDEDDADAGAKEEAEDEESRDSYLLKLIAEGSEDSFLDAINRAYELALKQFTESIARPIEYSLLQAAQNEGLSLHHPRDRESIADWWEWYVRAKDQRGGNVRVSVGCSFSPEKRSESGSGLYAYPWIWTTGRKRAENLAGELGNGFCIPTKGAWPQGTIITKSPIYVAPDGKAENFVTQITNKLAPAMPKLARLAQRRDA